MSIYILCLLLFAIGIYCVIVKKNLVKIIIGLSICEYAVNLFFILAGYKYHGRAPILAPDQQIANMVDPIPQALILTSIVIGLAFTILIVSIALRLYDKYGTFDISQIRRLRG